MRKQIIAHKPAVDSNSEHNWLNLEKMAQVEITSESSNHPIEAAFMPNSNNHWQADAAGEQSIILQFDEPQRITHIRLLFQESHQERSQEFLLCWSADDGKSYQDITRQQFNFSSPDSTQQLEDYSVQLNAVTTLKLCITPDISRGNAHASLHEWRIA